MERSVRTPALNPASMPFFPGGARANDDERASVGGFMHRSREQDRNSMSSLSISPSEYRSVRSSPSPPQQDLDTERGAIQHPFGVPGERLRRSPMFHSVEASRPYPTIETRSPREGSVLGSLDALPEGEDNQDTPGPLVGDNGMQAPKSFFSLQQEHATPPVAINVNQNGSSYNGGGAFVSSSPVSSLDSGSHFTPTTDSSQSFEAQLKASPLMHDILDRLVRCEYSTREIQRDLGDMHRKVNLLVERSLGATSQPEFKDPFAPTLNGSSFSPSLNGPRPSIANIAPNQVTASDDMASMSRRLDTLTSSLGQLLALQTQQIHSTSLTNNSPQIDLAPNQMMSPPGLTGASMLGHGLPHRPDFRPTPRAPNSPMRTWSAGNIDLSVRPSDPGRQEALLRDKRRSVSGLVRRDSASVRPLILLINQV